MIRPKRRFALFIAMSLCCATSSLFSAAAGAEDRRQWNEIPLSKIYPFPSKEERARQISRVRVSVEAAEGVPRDEAGAARREIQKQLAEQIRESGAKTVSKGASYAVVAEILDYEYEAEFDGPTNWLFKSKEEMAAKPGKCKHYIDLEVEIDVYQGRRKEPISAWTLEASAKGETKTADQSCPFETTERLKLVVEALREAMPCLQVELMNHFAPRGHIVSHRRYGEKGADIFRTTIDRGTLPDAANSFSIERVQWSSDAKGHRERKEHRIAKGSIADQKGKELWIEVNLTKTSLPILAGDVVRPIIDRGMVRRMSPFGGGCGDTLEPRE